DHDGVVEHGGDLAEHLFTRVERRALRRRTVLRWTRLPRPVAGSALGRGGALCAARRGVALALLLLATTLALPLRLVAVGAAFARSSCFRAASLGVSLVVTLFASVVVTRRSGRRLGGRRGARGVR